MRNVSLNCHYLVLFKNPRDKSQITHLAKQIHPSNVKALCEIYKNATMPSFGYLLIDLRPETDERLRFRTGIFSGDIQYVYEPR